MLRPHQPRKDHDPPGLDDEVVVTPAIVRAAQLHDAQSAALTAIVGRQLFEQDDSMRNTLDAACRAVAFVQEEDGAAPTREEVLEADDLATVPKWVARQQFELGQ